MWRLSKSAIPCSLATRVNGHVNPKLMRSIRIWQWRWQSSKENVLEKTGRMLQKRMESWKRKKNPARFQHKNPCKLQANMLKPLDFPRENSMIFEMKINSFAMAKTTFFQKRSKRWRGFPPDGMFKYPTCAVYLGLETTALNCWPAVYTIILRRSVWEPSHVLSGKHSPNRKGLTATSNSLSWPSWVDAHQGPGIHRDPCPHKILSAWNKTPFLSSGSWSSVLSVKSNCFRWFCQTHCSHFKCPPQFPNWSKSLPVAAYFLSGASSRANFTFVCWKYQLVGICCYISNLQC